MADWASEAALQVTAIEVVESPEAARMLGADGALVSTLKVACCVGSFERSRAWSTDQNDSVCVPGGRQESVP